MSRLALDIAALGGTETRPKAHVSIARSNEIFGQFGTEVFAVKTFSESLGALASAWRIGLLRKTLSTYIKANEIDCVINLMPHVWTPYMIGTIKVAGAQYMTVVHDAQVHPGDYRTGIAKSFLDQETRRADRVLTLSHYVANQLVDLHLCERDRINVLFHPDLHYGDPLPSRRAMDRRALRLLFLGRIMPYKGLELFADTIEILRREGHPVEVGVFGEGALGETAKRLAAMGAEIQNRWISDRDVADIIARYDVMVLSHLEASQSGVVSLAHGAGMPVVATPVGALMEQLGGGRTGIVAAAVSAQALSDSLRRLIEEPTLYQSLADAIVRSQHERSIAAFVDACLRAGSEQEPKA
jgi:glycosyltransferase involved in cell wall biosynthesis